MYFFTKYYTYNECREIINNLAEKENISTLLINKETKRKTDIPFFPYLTDILYWVLCSYLQTNICSSHVLFYAKLKVKGF